MRRASDRVPIFNVTELFNMSATIFRPTKLFAIRDSIAIFIAQRIDQIIQLLRLIEKAPTDVVGELAVHSCASLDEGNR